MENENRSYTGIVYNSKILYVAIHQTTEKI